MRYTDKDIPFLNELTPEQELLTIGDEILLNPIYYKDKVINLVSLAEQRAFLGKVYIIETLAPQGYYGIAALGFYDQGLKRWVPTKFCIPITQGRYEFS